METLSPPSSTSPYPAASDLYLKTWEALKAEIAQSVADARTLERNTLLLCGGIWAYLAGAASPAPDLFWYVPILLVVFAVIRVCALMISINPRARYLREIENLSLSSMKLEGWETYFRSHYRRGVGISMILFWALLFAATLYMARSHPSVRPAPRTGFTASVGAPARGNGGMSTAM